jgi:elongation factor P
MDDVNFDQMTISEVTVGDAANYMLENTSAIVAIHEGNPLFIDLPASVPLKITGIQIQVPLFIKQDEVVLVDTRDGSYQGRAN